MLRGMGLTREQHKEVGECLKRIAADVAKVFYVVSGAYPQDAGPSVSLQKFCGPTSDVVMVLRTVLKSAAATEQDAGFAEETYGPTVGGP
jgi:hypothetical protein